MNISLQIARLRAAVAARIAPTVTVGGLKFYCPSPLCAWRAHTLFTKEPETIEWINGMAMGECLWDVGANVGLYSMYAASRDLHVYAIEPEAGNHAILCRNIVLNDARIVALPIALTDLTGIGRLNLSTPTPGAAMHQFGYFGQLAVLGYSIDDLIEQFRLMPPTHIKLDVDGIELKILRGARETLRHVRSVLVECDGTQHDDDIIHELHVAGFKLSWRLQSWMMSRGKYANYFNCLFERS